MRTARNVVTITVSCATLAVAARAQSSFAGFAFPENGYFSPLGVSADGQSAIGMAYVVGLGDVARRWRNGIGFDYPGPSSGAVANWASGISASGAAISGGTGHAAFGDLEGWARNGASVGHVGSPPGHDTSDLRGVSANGAVFVGYGGHQSNPNLFQAARYTEAGGWTNLPFLAGGTDSKALATNLDGSVVVGWSTDSSGAYSTAFRWTASTGTVSLPHLPGGYEAEANAVNHDGSVIVGDDYAIDASWTSQQTAWRWTSAGGTESLGFLPGGASSVATDVSDDGSVVVGYADAGGGYTGFVWDAAHGMRDLRDVLIANGLEQSIAGWDFSGANAIVGSGPWYLVGDGADSTGTYAGWIARIETLGPVAGRAICFGDGSGSACPCGNFSQPTENAGCANSLGSGGVLTAIGSASVAGDSFVLSAGGMPSSSALYFQGSSRVAGGLGSTFGDGLRCAGGAIVRLGTHTNSAGASQFPDALDPSVSTRGGVQPGDVRVYQVWYRNAAAFCSTATFNLTNAFEQTWTL